MEILLKPYIERAIKEDIICIQEIVWKIFQKTFSWNELSAERSLFMEFSYFLTSKVNYSLDDRIHLQFMKSVSKKLNAQTDILQSKLGFAKTDLGLINSLFIKLKIHLNSLLFHFTQFTSK